MIEIQHSFMSTEKSRNVKSVVFQISVVIALLVIQSLILSI